MTEWSSAGGGYGEGTPNGPQPPVPADSQPPQPAADHRYHPAPFDQGAWQTPAGAENWTGDGPLLDGPPPIISANRSGITAPPPMNTGYGPAWSPTGDLKPVGAKNRKPLFIALGGGVAVLVIIGIALAVSLIGNSGPGSGGSPGDVVKAYLEALSKGDAEAALALGADQPGSKDFLTDDILKEQIAKWPISNIRILSDENTANPLGMSTVHVTATFGDKTSDAVIPVKKVGGQWRLSTAAAKLKPLSITLNRAAEDTVTFFGKPIGDSTVYVFPGWIDVGSSNAYLSVTAQPILLDHLLDFVPPFTTNIEFGDGGQQALTDALTNAFAACQASRQLAPPPPCPASLAPYAFAIADGTVNWGPADVSRVSSLFLDGRNLSLSLTGTAQIPITAATPSGGQFNKTVTQFVNGTLDLTTTPPALKLGR